MLNLSIKCNFVLVNCQKLFHRNSYTLSCYKMSKLKVKISQRSVKKLPSRAVTIFLSSDCPMITKLINHLVYAKNMRYCKETGIKREKEKAGLHNLTVNWIQSRKLLISEHIIP